MEKLPIVRSAADVRGLFAHLADLPCEVIGFGYLDRDWRLIGSRYTVSDSASAAAVPIREVARDVLIYSAARVVMAHNHPSGDPTPSQADICATGRLARVLAALGVPLVEHVILARAGFVSLRAKKLL